MLGSVPVIESAKKPNIEFGDELEKSCVCGKQITYRLSQDCVHSQQTFKSFDQWSSGNVLKDSRPRKEVDSGQNIILRKYANDLGNYPTSIINVFACSNFRSANI